MTLTASRSHCAKNDKPFITPYAQLAMSLVFDLGLNKPGNTHPSPMLSFKNQRDDRPVPPLLLTMEDRRAVLATFFLTSMYGCPPTARFRRLTFTSLGSPS